MKLSKILKGQLQKIGKYAIFPLLLFLLSYSVDFHAGEIGKVWGIPVAIPVSFSLLAASAWCLAVSLLSQSIYLIVLMKSELSDVLKRQRCDPDILEFLYENEDYTLIQPLNALPHFRTFGLVSFLIVGILSVSLVMTALGAVCLFLYLYSVQYDLLFSSIGPVEKIASFTGMILVLFSLLFPVLFHAPIRVQKSAFHIRWGILYNYHPRGAHPKANTWRKDEAN